MRMRLVQAAGIALLCGAVVGPAQAAPGGDATVQPAFFLAPVGSAGAAASCPAGQRITGGGIGTNVDPATDLAQASGPLDEFGQTATTLDTDVATSWYGNVSNFVDGTAYRTFAVCSASSDALVYESTFTLPGLSDGGAFETCPAGTRAVGGGVGTTESSVAGVVKESAPLGPGGTIGNSATGQEGRSWTARVRNPSGETRTYRTFVLCSATSDATIEAASFTVGSQANGQDVAACPAGRRALGGGVGNVGDQTRVRVSQPLDQNGTAPGEGEAAGQWYASVYNIDSGPRVFKVFALCASDDTGGAPQPSGGGGQGPSSPGPGGGGGGAPGSGPAAGATDTVLPVISGLSLSRRSFRAGGSGAVVRFTLSEAGSVRLTVERATSGRRVDGRCARPTRSNRRARRCTRYAALSTTLRRQGSAGSNRLTFRGRLAGRELRAGGYRLRIVATDAAGNRSSAVIVRFRIVR
ncbi:MAG TPA: hypothetical protein VGP78_09590 [Solirubrobacteraceae bacterium]|nr:hypothetical protein [Solirubrobacteraceae bacterium]